MLDKVLRQESLVARYLLKEVPLDILNKVRENCLKAERPKLVSMIDDELHDRAIKENQHERR